MMRLKLIDYVGPSSAGGEDKQIRVLHTASLVAPPLIVSCIVWVRVNNDDSAFHYRKLEEHAQRRDGMSTPDVESRPGIPG